MTVIREHGFENSILKHDLSSGPDGRGEKNMILIGKLLTTSSVGHTFIVSRSAANLLISI